MYSESFIGAVDAARGSPAVVQSFRGRAGHDINTLQQQLAQLGVRPPVHIAKALSLASGWSVDLRYEPGDSSIEDATDFLSAVVEIVNWVDEKL